MLRKKKGLDHAVAQDPVRLRWHCGGGLSAGRRARDGACVGWASNTKGEKKKEKVMGKKRKFRELAHRER